eukprot:UN08447
MAALVKSLKTLSAELPSDASSLCKTVRRFQGHYAFGLENGSVVLVAPKFLVTFPNNERKLTPRLDYPLGKMALEVDEQGAAIR